MIRLSAKAEYAVRAVLQLSLEAGSKSFQLSEISKAQKVPREFLVQVMADLIKSGIVSSRRGSQGGYKLRYPPCEIHLKQVIEAVDGAIGEFSCDESLAQCRGEDCIFKPIWEELVDGVSQKLTQIDFGRLSERARHNGGVPAEKK